jgi:hypothetical protein
MFLTCFKLFGLTLAAILCLCWFLKEMLQEPDSKAKEISGDKAVSLKHVWLNIRITTFTPTFTDVSKRHVNKDLYSIQELCHNI